MPDKDPASCVGIRGQIHPETFRAFIESMPATEQDALRMAIQTQDPNSVSDPESFQQYLDAGNLALVPIASPANGCTEAKHLLFFAHTFEKTADDGSEILTATPCLGLAANPSPAYWHCSSEPAVDAFNQQNCIDPAFKGLGCVPLDQSGLSITPDKNPCFEQAKAEGQELHATTKTVLQGLGITDPLIEKPYNITKCFGETGKTFLVGAEQNVEDNGQSVVCHGFATRPASPTLECYEIYPESEPAIPPACGPRWVCLAKPS